MQTWPLAVYCPDCKKQVCRFDMVDKKDILAFKVKCECGAVCSYSAKSAKVTALHQLPKDQKRLS